MHVFRITCPIREVTDINRGGAGWESAQTDEDNDQVNGRFCDEDCLQALHRVLAQTHGQDLAHYADDPNLERIDVLLTLHEAQFFLHFNEQPTPEALVSVRNFVSGQISDGWGETFEQMDFGLQESHYRNDIDYRMGFSLDYRGVSEILPYDPASMKNLHEVEAFANQQRSGAKAAIHP